MKNLLAIQQEKKYKRHRPEATLLYQLVERYYPEFTANLAEQGKYLPRYVEREFDEFLRCGRLEHDFLRVVCGDCKHEKLVAFSCKRRGLCHSCGARRMEESAALLVDDVLCGYPIRKWVHIDISECEKHEKHNVSIIACIIDSRVIHKILAHLEKKYPTSKQTTVLPPLRAPSGEQQANEFTIQCDLNFGAQTTSKTQDTKKYTISWYESLHSLSNIAVPKV
jgi:ribosomal protein S27E